jgi:hypothetical protein
MMSVRPALANRRAIAAPKAPVPPMMAIVAEWSVIHSPNKSKLFTVNIC